MQSKGKMRVDPRVYKEYVKRKGAGTLSPCEFLTLLHSERPKLYGVLAVLSAIGLNKQLPLMIFKISIHRYLFFDESTQGRN